MTSSPAVSAPDEQEQTPSRPGNPAAGTGWRIRGTIADRLEVVLPWLGYLALVVSGVTTSSLGLLSRSGSVTGGQWGASLPVRSDEWLTAAPLELSTLANGSTMHSPLSNGPDLIYQMSSGSPIESVLFLEGNLLRLGAWLPDSMLFAAFRGWSWLLLALALPPLLRRFGANRPMSWLAVALCMAAPAAVWWSFMPIRVLGIAAAGCYLLVLAAERAQRGHWWRGLGLAAAAGLFLPRLLTYYVPWSLTIGVPLVLATGTYLVCRKGERRVALTVIGAGAAVGLFLVAGTFWENWTALHAELNTVYPGLRRSSGAALEPFQLFGAPGLFDLEGHVVGGGLNQSEISSAYLICGVVAALLWPLAWAHTATRERAAQVTLGLFILLELSWVTLTWGELGEHVPGLSSLPPARVAQTIGFPCALLMCLVLSGWARARSEGATSRMSPELRRALLVGVVVAVLTGYASGRLPAVVEGMPTWQSTTAAVVTGAVAALLTWRPASWLPVAVTSLVVVLAGVTVNPITFGLGDLRTSPAADRARALRAHSLAEDSRVVSDAMATNALLVANGVPVLGGYQVTGPVERGWAEVDPADRYEDIWNRGASYVLFSFDGQPGADPTVIEVQNDLIQVRTDACWLADSRFDVDRLITAVRIDSPCADRIGRRMTWGGVDLFVYALTPSRTASS
ncbi:hypothetical protein FBY23_4050 [Nocardioides sp. SLBN-35]|nr:hypothetical protein FBY23_4050 [Nocardioides sp. SLBN-35]